MTDEDKLIKAKERYQKRLRPSIIDCGIYKRAAMNGDKDGQFLYSSYISEKRFVFSDAAAQYWMEKSAENGHPDARLYIEQIKGRDVKESEFSPNEIEAQEKSYKYHRNNILFSMIASWIIFLAGLIVFLVMLINGKVVWEEYDWSIYPPAISVCFLFAGIIFTRIWFMRYKIKPDSNLIEEEDNEKEEGITEIYLSDPETNLCYHKTRDFFLTEKGKKIDSRYKRFIKWRFGVPAVELKSKEYDLFYILECERRIDKARFNKKLCIFFGIAVVAIFLIFAILSLTGII